MGRPLIVARHSLRSRSSAEVAIRQNLQSQRAPNHGTLGGLTGSWKRWG